MADASISLIRELEELVREQIHAFKKSSELSDGEILDYHLRYYRIIELYRALDRVSTIPKKGWLA